MSERRYTEEEVKQIFASAAESEVLESTPSRGMTLAEVQRIGEEAGLSTAAVTAAAVSLDHASQVAVVPRVFGLRDGVAQTVALPRPLDDAAWRQLVAYLRDTFQAQGRESEVRGRQEWRNGNLRVSIEPLGDGALLHMRTRKGGARSLVRTGVALLVGAGVMEGVILAAHAGMATMGALQVGLTGVALTAVGALQLPRWSSERERQFASVADYARKLSAQ